MTPDRGRSHGEQDRPFERVKRVRTHEMVFAQIVERILRGELAAGSRLPSERALMAEFGASRGSVREALRIAETMGLLEVHHGDPGGPIVTAEPGRPVSRALGALIAADVGSLADLVEVRMVLEGATTLLASRTPLELAEVEAAMAEMEASEDEDAFVGADIVFHLRVAEACGNPALQLLTTALQEPIRDALQISIRETGASRNRELSIRRHRAVLKAMLAGDGKLARYRAHLGKLANFDPMLDDLQRVRLHALAAADAVAGESPDRAPWRIAAAPL